MKKRKMLANLIMGISKEHNMKKKYWVSLVAAAICVICSTNNVSATPLGTIQNPAASAKQILMINGWDPNGLYYIDFDGVGSSPVQQIYADMTINGGGWTLLVASTASGLSGYDYFGTGNLHDFINSHTGWSFLFDLNSQLFSTTSGIQQFQDWNPGTSFGTPGSNVVNGEILTLNSTTTLSIVFNEQNVSFNQQANWKIYGREGDNNYPVMSSPVPEPATMLLLGIGLAGFAGMNLRGKKK